MSVGEIGLRQRRPSTPGANTQLLYNQAGVEGASRNLTFDFGNNSLNVVGTLNVTTLATTQNASIGNVSAANINVSSSINTFTINATSDIYIAGNVWVTGNSGNTASFDDVATSGVVYASALRLLPHMGSPIF